MTTSEEEVEEVDDEPVAEPPIEQVNDMDDEQPEESENEDEVSIDHYITQSMSQLTGRVQDGLNDHQCGADLQEKPVKKVSTLDILTVMSDRVKVKFIIDAGKGEVEKGRWCNICK